MPQIWSVSPQMERADVGVGAGWRAAADTRVSGGPGREGSCLGRRRGTPPTSGHHQIAIARPRAAVRAGRPGRSHSASPSGSPASRRCDADWRRPGQRIRWPARQAAGLRRRGLQQLVEAHEVDSTVSACRCRALPASVPLRPPRVPAPGAVEVHHALPHEIQFHGLRHRALAVGDVELRRCRPSPICPKIAHRRRA